MITSISRIERKRKKISIPTDRWRINVGSIANEKAIEPLFLILIVKLKKNKKL